MKISSIRWGVIWVGIGLIFLAINFEVMDSLVFPRLFSLWPVLLIAIGVELIFRRTKLYFLALLSPLLIAAAFVVAASHYTGGWDFEKFFHGWSWTYKVEKDDSVQIPMEAGLDTLFLELDCAGIDFDVRPDPRNLFSARSTYFSTSPLVSNRTDGGRAYVKYDYRDRGRLGFLNLWGSSAYAEIRVTNSLPIKALLTTEYKRPVLNFADYPLVSLGLSVKSSEVALRLGALEDSVKVDIEGEARRVDITLPEDMGIEVIGNVARLRRSLKNVEFVETPEGFRSEGFLTDRLKARIVVAARIESISVERD